MGNYYLAVDIGASSGRHILCHVDNGKMLLEEIYRFENGMKDIDGTKCWDVEELFAAIKAGMNSDIRELKKMVEAVLTSPELKSCPHGRPTSVELTKQQIEKMFKRIV